MNKLSMQQLDEIKSRKDTPKNWIKVGMSTCGIAAGADKAMETLKQELERNNLEISLEQCGCAGRCYAEPLVEVCISGMPRVVYGNVDEETAKDIVAKHILDKRLINDHIYNIKVD